MVEHQARDLEVRGSNPGPGSDFSLDLDPIGKLTKHLTNNRNKRANSFREKNEVVSG